MYTVKLAKGNNSPLSPHLSRAFAVSMHLSVFAAAQPRCLSKRACGKLPAPEDSMTPNEKKRLSALLRATEYLFLENLALKLLLEHRQIANWQTLLDHLLADKEIMAGVRLKFRDLSRQIAATNDPSDALDALLAELPKPRKIH
jgi:hypothetical protein